MCGILGQINFNGWDGPFPQLDLLQHRGPDGSGEWKNSIGNIYLGHTRLAILDPTPAGQQPMTDSTNRFTIVFNGEIYNHLKLREILPAVNWCGNSDTETLIELLAQKGVGVLSILKGMFSFALYDKLDNSVLLVRDRFGIKPLWYKTTSDYISFSSEIRALPNTKAIQLTKNALSEYIGFGRMPGVGNVFEGIQSLPPGTWLKVDSKGAVENRKWWPMGNFTKIESSGTRDVTLKVKKLVTKAIEEHLISDVGVGSFLSGGIDSSIVTLIAGKSLGDNLQTFTVGFPQKTYDERAIARKVAKQVGSAHNELEINPDQCLTWVKEAVFSLDLPSIDAINTYIVSRAVKDAGLKVALSGLGGDELFGGYPTFKHVPWFHLLNLLPTKGIQRTLSIMPTFLKNKIQGLDSFTAIELTCAYRRFTSIATLKEMGLSKGIPIIPEYPYNLDLMGQISWAEIYGYMVPMLLRDSDQMSMAVGLEIRVPFLDHNLVESVLGLSQKFKKGSGIKALLVDAFKDELPFEVYSRPKQGFTLPMGEWLLDPLAGFAEDGIISASELLSLSQPLQQYNKFKKGKLHWTRIWLWVVLGHWLFRHEKVASLNSFCGDSIINLKY